jgi:hypothetical protein
MNLKTNKIYIGITLFISIYLCKTTNVHGQKAITTQNLIWYSNYTTLEINKKWYLLGEIQERHFVTPLKQHQFLVRGHLHYKIFEKWDISSGMCLFLQDSNDPYAEKSLTVPELRPHIEGINKQKIGGISIDYRFRGEARFYHNTNAGRTLLEEGYFFSNYRLRFRIQATIPLFKITESKKIKLKLSDELHLNAGNTSRVHTFDQNRIYAGVNLEVSPNLNWEINYLNWFQKRNETQYFNRNIFILTCNNRISFK